MGVGLENVRPFDVLQAELLVLWHLDICLQTLDCIDHAEVLFQRVSTMGSPPWRKPGPSW